MHFIVGDYWTYWWCLAATTDNFFNMLMVKKLKSMGLRKMYRHINHWWIILPASLRLLSTFYALWESDSNSSLLAGASLIEVGSPVLCTSSTHEILAYHVCVIYSSLFVPCESRFPSVFIVVYLNCRTRHQCIYFAKSSEVGLRNRK